MTTLDDSAYHVYRVDTSRREKAWIRTFDDRADAASFLDSLHRDLRDIDRKSIYFVMYSENVNAEQVKLESP